MQPRSPCDFWSLFFGGRLRDVDERLTDAVGFGRVLDASDPKHLPAGTGWLCLLQHAQEPLVLGLVVFARLVKRLAVACNGRVPDRVEDVPCNQGEIAIKVK